MSDQEESEYEVIAVSKQQKSRSEVIVNDRISSLPDSLLHHILSFLPTREVVATSLLSKRWRPLWHSMPTFDFEGRGISSLDFFIQFVDAVLLLADWKPIEKFRLKCRTFCTLQNGLRFEYKRVPPTRINIWISTAINRKVEHFELCSDDNEYIVAASSIFNGTTIRVLKLNWVRLDIPSSVKLPSLKVMHLVKVKLTDYECLANFLSGCALLEELVLDVSVDDDGGGEEEGEGEEEEDFTVNIEKLEHLVLANVHSFLINSKALTNVTCLQLYVDKPPVRDIPIFDKLNRLEISSVEYEHLKWVMECLRSCPKLEILMINEIYVRDDSDRGREGALMEPTQDVPQCLLSHLKEFTLRDYDGWKWEFEIARYIMENAKVLRTISIHCVYMDVDEKYKNLNMLASCPRGSEHCSFLFD
ncbi:hypothetical protein QN277_024967 [Acacia crassicarpa]|uniref:F-box domain-containing protein n=1 Tax=Acacia crassicarpa TaxID=499986 RepID=A0AAE1JHW8_9FABA|nr:hypothetical protein QN277_024967 [Acacia crassicarpa]